MSTIFQKQEVTLNELKAHVEVLDDLEEGELVANITCTSNGTWPKGNDDNPKYWLDKNDNPQRSHTFLVMEGEAWDRLEEEYGEDTPIPWRPVLYEAGISASQFTRDLEEEVPRGAPCTVTVQKSGEYLNVIDHEVHIATADDKARFQDHKEQPETETAINTSSHQTNGEGVPA